MTDLRINDPDDFRFYPMNHVCVVFDTRDTTLQVIETLESKGYGGRDVKVIHGPEGAKLLDVDGSNHGWFGRFIRTWQKASDNHIPHLRRVERAVTDGNYGMAIAVHSETQRDEVVQIMKDHQGDMIIFCGEVAIVAY